MRVRALIYEVAKTERQREMEELEKKVERGGRRLKELLRKAEDLHAKSKALHTELISRRSPAHNKDKNRQP